MKNETMAAVLDSRMSITITVKQSPEKSNSRKWKFAWLKVVRSFEKLKSRFELSYESMCKDFRLYANVAATQKDIHFEQKILSLIKTFCLPNQRDEIVFLEKTSNC